MQISINGRPFELEEQSSLMETIRQLDINQSGMAVAVNSVVVPHDKWKEFLLKENDSVMIIRATQGG